MNKKIEPGHNTSPMGFISSHGKPIFGNGGQGVNQNSKSRRKVTWTRGNKTGNQKRFSDEPKKRVRRTNDTLQWGKN